ncbi:hypothetical protein [Microbacterium sp. No. 7]|uniref:hypothetical protein n=1 Tax=Microbacterium sp. No. 7 TaxID=1714373 RepID=UPI0006D088FA|nr:hypothetical protein [Microbacterium sp. No. 7]ALJ21431.1 hypothetical protein AOA12_16625 [Microbacterium sp. No. 7]
MGEDDDIGDRTGRTPHQVEQARMTRAAAPRSTPARDGIWVEWVRPTDLGTRMAGMLARNGVGLERRLRTALMARRIDANGRLRSALSARRSRVNGPGDPSHTVGMTGQRAGVGR